MSSIGVFSNPEKCEERREADFYPTPWQATEALSAAEYDYIYEKNVYEPACGDGAIAKHLETYYGCTVHGTDLHSRGYGQGGIDFITSPVSDLLSPRFSRDCLITNPPFNVAEAFIKRAHGLNFGYIAFLLKSTYFHADSRVSLFNEFRPSRIYPLAWRIDFTGGGANHFDCSWFVWDKLESFPHTLYMNPLKRPEYVGIKKMF
jgi:hypothetical protein